MEQTPAPTPTSTAQPPQLHPRRLDVTGLAVIQVVLGIWLSISPAALLPHPIAVHAGYWNAVAVGGLMVLSGLLFGVRASSASSLSRTVSLRRGTWFWLALSAWLLISPWVLGYSSHTWMTANAVIVALVQAAVAIAAWSLTTRMGSDGHRGIQW